MTVAGGLPPFKIQVLTPAELDSVAAGGPFSENDVLGGDCSCCVSQCHVDGNNEPGTS
jgi:hypothetical protein